MSKRKCFVCVLSGTFDCPAVAYEAYNDRFGYDAAGDLGYEKISCKNCYHNTGKCEDCLFQNVSEVCHEE